MPSPIFHPDLRRAGLLPRSVVHPRTIGIIRRLTDRAGGGPPPRGGGASGGGRGGGRGVGRPPRPPGLNWRGAARVW